MTPNMYPPAVSKAVEDSVTAFFTGSCGLTPLPEARAEDSPAAGIMSTISFRGDVPWSFALAFSEHEAGPIAKAFAGFDIPFDGPDMGDAVGEIVNVIAGDISGRLGKIGIDAQMSLPDTVRGGSFARLIPLSAPATRLTFSGPAGTCWFDLVGTPVDPAPGAADPEPDGPGVPEVPPSEWLRPQGSTPANEETFALPPPSDAWAAEAEAERQLAEQDAAAAALRAAGEPPLTGPAVAATARPAGRVRVRGRQFLYLALVFACGGGGVLAGVLVTRAKRAPTEAAPPDGHAVAPSAAPKNPLPHIDALIRSGRVTEALQECIGAPRNAPGAGETALALREGLCLEGTGQWWEASNAYQKAEADPNVAVAALALLGRARCAAQEGSYALARALANRVFFRSGHPDCRGLRVREEVRYLRSQIDALESGSASVYQGGSARPPLSASAYNGLDWVADAPANPAPGPSREVLEVHRTPEIPGALRVTVRSAPRPTIAVLRALGSAAGWKVQAGDADLAFLNAPVGPLDVDHVSLSEFLDPLLEGTGVTWAVQSDVLLLTRRGRGGARP